MDKFVLDKVLWFPQVDNKFDPYVNCFATSNAMASTYCLSLVGKTKLDVGCHADMQLEDYIYEYIQSPQVDEWIKKTFKANWWGWAFVNKGNKKVLWEVQQYVANQLLNPFGFKTTIDYAMSYDKYCNTILKTQLPILLGGDFRSVSTVQGHLNCGVGFNSVGLQELIVHDPYGNCLDGYKRHDNGAFCQYGTRFFIKSNGFMMGMVYSKI